MRIPRLIVATLPLALAGCAVSPSTTCPTTFVLNVTPSPATADHMATAPGNQQEFTATAAASTLSGSQSCVLSNVISSVTWTSSDTVNVQLTSPTYDQVVATCVGSTTGAVTITATQYAGGEQGKGTATLTCK